MVMVIPFLVMLVASCSTFDNINDLRKLRYQGGSQKGAEVCASCHEQVYNQWSKRSRHSLATKSKPFRHAVKTYSNHFIIGQFMDETMCYSCHGRKEVNEGVNCETCHGTVLPGVPIEKTHSDKFTPRLKEMRKPDFCARCHQSKTPISGDALSSTFTDWQASKAAASGKTCQSCHMKKRNGDERAYHGFDTFIRDESIYQGDITISRIRTSRRELRLTIENRIGGHSIPAGGPTRILALELSFRDREGGELFTRRITFAKRFSLLPIVGTVPFMLSENTQLRSNEKRVLRVALPEDILLQPKRVVIVLRMYEVSEEYEGNVDKAHWVSKPILKREVGL